MKNKLYLASLFFIVALLSEAKTVEKRKAKPQELPLLFQEKNIQNQIIQSLNNKEDKIYFQQAFANINNLKATLIVNGEFLTIYTPKEGMNQVVTIVQNKMYLVNGKFIEVQEGSSIVKMSEVLGEAIVNSKKRVSLFDIISKAQARGASPTQVNSAISFYLVYSNFCKIADNQPPPQPDIVPLNQEYMINTKNKRAQCDKFFPEVDLQTRFAKIDKNIQCSRQVVMAKSNDGELSYTFKNDFIEVYNSKLNQTIKMPLLKANKEKQIEARCNTLVKNKGPEEYEDCKTKLAAWNLGTMYDDTVSIDMNNVVLCNTEKKAKSDCVSIEKKELENFSKKSVSTFEKLKVATLGPSISESLTVAQKAEATLYPYSYEFLKPLNQLGIGMQILGKCCDDSFCKEKIKKEQNIDLESGIIDKTVK